VPVVAVARVEELGAVQAVAGQAQAVAGQGQAVAQVVVAWPVAAAPVQALLEVGLVPVEV